MNLCMFNFATARSCSNWAICVLRRISSRRARVRATSPSDVLVGGGGGSGGSDVGGGAAYKRAISFKTVRKALTKFSLKERTVGVLRNSVIKNVAWSSLSIAYSVSLPPVCDESELDLKSN